MFAALDASILLEGLPFILAGLLFSLKLTLVAMSGGILFGTALALVRHLGPGWLAATATVYVNVMRSIPLVMVILWFFLVIPLLTGRPIGAENSALITFTAFEAAFFAEIIRAGINSVPRGQTWAAEALGMSRLQTMVTVVLPQAFRAMIPLLLTQTIVLFQDSSLVYAIGAKDLLKAADIVGKNYNRPVELYLFAAALYFAICFSLSQMVKSFAGGRT